MRGLAVFRERTSEVQSYGQADEALGRLSTDKQQRGALADHAPGISIDALAEARPSWRRTTFSPSRVQVA